jgi:membrane protein implicated in regulation of membrane protease activity
MDIYSFVLSSWFWLVLMVALTLIELACSFNLVTIWFAISAFIMIFISGLTELLDTPIRFRLHLGIFLGLAILLLVFTRPIAVKKLKVGKVKTNVDDLAGRDALVVQEITKYGRGQVKIRGQIWTAISETNEEIAENTECVIIRIEGVKAVVRKK